MSRRSFSKLTSESKEPPNRSFVLDREGRVWERHDEAVADLEWPDDHWISGEDYLNWPDLVSTWVWLICRGSDRPDLNLIKLVDGSSAPIGFGHQVKVRKK